MSLISLFNASKDYGIKNLFSNIDIHINQKERLGLIGSNGSGKSTLLKIIAGNEKLDRGRRECSASIRIALAGQSILDNSRNSVLDEVLSNQGEKKDLLLKYSEINKELSVKPEDPLNIKKLGNIVDQMDQYDAWNLERECTEILTRLGITDLKSPICQLSGGYRKRVGLASAMIKNPDVLLLDEPTNHLDSKAAEWLQNWLKNFKGALILVTHDRYFLDSITNKLLEVKDGKLKPYEGNYSYFLQKKLEDEKIDINKEKKLQALIRKELAWLKKGAKARSTKQKARINRINDIRKNNISKKNDKLELELNSSKIGKRVIEIQNLTIKIGKSSQARTLIQDFNYSFSPTDRIGIVGENGSGKSIFMDTIAKRILPSFGSVKHGDTVKIGYLDQFTIDLFDREGLERKVIDYIEEVGSTIEINKTKISASKLLERFLFTPAQQHAPISKLSGGEKRRLNICKILIQKPNILLLDEPTNDLDIDTLNVFEDYLEKFNGCIIVISHDRYFLNKVVNRIFNITNKKIRRYEGNYSDFIEKTISIQENESLDKLKSQNKKIYNKSRNTSIKKISFKEKKELEFIETNLPFLEKEKLIIEKNIKGDKGNIDELSNKLADLVKEIDILEEKWLEINEKLI